MGIIRRKGVYWVDYYYRDELGRQRRRREAVGRSRKLADDLLKKRLAEVAERRFFPERQQVLVKFSDAAVAYLEWAHANVSAEGADALWRVPPAFVRIRAGSRSLGRR